MRIKADENLPIEAAALLVAAGIDALTVLEQRMGGGGDPALARACNAEGRALLTLDLDFADIRLYPPAEHAGLIVLRPRNQAKLHVLALLRQSLDHLKTDEARGQLWIVDETGIRIRE